jgi:opacity protein-like surface antigen
VKISSAVCVLGLGFVLGSIGFTGSAKAQANFTAQRPADITVFGGYGHTTPDYDAGHDNGVTLGAEYNRSFGWRVIPGLEVRANLNSGPAVTENSYVFGPRAHMNFHRFHPYADFLVGLGRATYPEYFLNGVAQVQDTGLVYTYGGGVDYDLVKGFALRADYQGSSWNLGKNLVAKPDGSNFTLSPTTVTIGVSYRIPFKNWTGQKHESH